MPPSREVFLLQKEEVRIMNAERAMRALEPNAEAGNLGAMVSRREIRNPLKEFSGKLPNRGSFPTAEDIFQASLLGGPADAVANAVLEGGRVNHLTRS
jgi:hypothetical protein